MDLVTTLTHMEVCSLVITLEVSVYMNPYSFVSGSSKRGIPASWFNDLQEDIQGFAARGFVCIRLVILITPTLDS
jgi:hypothetical protein